MQKLEGFLHSTYTYFSSPKRHLETMQACSIVEDKNEHIVVQYKDYVDLYVVSCQKGSWGVQIFDCDNELWSPYHLICENNFWVLVWYIEVVMGPHLHHAYVGNYNPWAHQVCWKSWDFCLWLYMKAIKMCHSDLCTHLIVIQRRSTLTCSSKNLQILWITQMMGC